MIGAIAFQAGHSVGNLAGALILRSACAVVGSEFGRGFIAAVYSPKPLK